MLTEGSHQEGSQINIMPSAVREHDLYVMTQGRNASLIYYGSELFM